MKIDRSILSEEDYQKLVALNNPKVMEIVETYANLCEPAKIKVITDSPEDIAYVRQLALEQKEERPLAMEGHTVHFDGPKDQARDKKNTRVLLPKGKKLSKHINSIDREEGLKEILGYMKGAMKGKIMLVRFFSLGPKNSRFTIPALQITDSAYVAHSEDLLYRQGYEVFQKLNGSPEFFYFVHSAGELDENGNSKNIDKRRIYIDLEENRVFSVNNQYAGNSLGLKKLALRLAINKAVYEGWLTEHMFIAGVHNLDKTRKTYFLGAFPSGCGKTSTAMIPGNTIVGDDIAYIRLNEKNEPHAVNIERGIFGIIKDVNPVDDPLIFKVLTTPREMIFSNVLVHDGKPYWTGMGIEIPDRGINFQGEWYKGKKDENGKEIPPSHGNARYTIRLEDLENVDPMLHDPNGVPMRAIIYGGRDSDTSVPIFQTFSWNHGVFIGAALESETTAATLGQEGVRKHNPMANLDFIVVPLSDYLKAHFKFGKKFSKPDLVQIFSTNYFLKDENGKFFDDKVDKKVWLTWAEGRIHGEYDAIETPIGYIPKYEDLKVLFDKIFQKEYSKEKYEKEFAIRITKWLEKLNRVEKSFESEENMPQEFYDELNALRNRLLAAKEKYQAEIIPPSSFE